MERWSFQIVRLKSRMDWLLAHCPSRICFLFLVSREQEPRSAKIGFSEITMRSELTCTIRLIFAWGPSTKFAKRWPAAS